MFLPPEENKRWKTFCTFDGSKSNYLSIINQMVRFKRLKISSKNKAEVSDFLVFFNFNLTLDKDPITESLFVFFPESH